MTVTLDREAPIAGLITEAHVRHLVATGRTRQLHQLARATGDTRLVELYLQVQANPFQRPPARRPRPPRPAEPVPHRAEAAELDEAIAHMTPVARRNPRVAVRLRALHARRDQLHSPPGWAPRRRAERLTTAEIRRLMRSDRWEVGS